MEYDAVTKSIFRIRTLGAAATLAIAVVLGGCGQQAAKDSQMTTASLPDLPATLPLDSSASTAWPVAPEVAALPDAGPIRTVRVAKSSDYYGYADAAYDYQDALGDAPPDYYFDYDGTDPWAWEGYDQSVVFLEPVDDGYRYYYYRPGAAEPYFVRDPYYGYGYDGGQLAVVYDSAGAVVPYDAYGARADYAARYYQRGRGLYAASRRDNRRAVSAVNWAARSAAIAAARTDWAANRDRQPAWRDYRARNTARPANYWREEAVRRQSDTRRFADWRDQSFRTPPPPRAIPAAWKSANWARDQKRFLPAKAERVADNQPRNVAPPPPRVDPGARLQPNAPQPQVVDPRRDRQGPGRAFRQPQGAAPQVQPQPQPNSQRMVRPRDQQRFAPGRAQPQPQPQTQPRAAIPQPQRQPQAGRNAFRARVEAPRPQPQVAPRAQPRPDIGRVQPQRPNFQRPQPQVARPPQAMRPQPQPQAARPQPQPQQPRVAPAIPRPNLAPGGVGGGNRGGGGGGGRNRGG